MKIGRIILAYVLLIVSAAFLDVDILALLALPIFITSTGMVIAFHLALVDKRSPKKWFGISLIIIGSILLSATVGYSAVKYIVYLRADASNAIQEPFPSLILNAYQIIGMNLLASLVIFLGLKKSIMLANKKLYLIWIPTLLLIPVVTLLISSLQLHKIGI